MWKVVVFALLVGCGGSECEPPKFSCGDDFARACGNNQIDFCEGPHVEDTCHSIGGKWETCDGTQVRSCAELGYYDGPSYCVDCLEVDATACRACASNASECVFYRDRFAVRKLVANGTRVLAIAKDFPAQSELYMFEGTTFLHGNGVSPTGTDAIAVPDGFLIVRGTELVPLARDGTFGTRRSLTGPVDGPRLAFGPDGRVLVAWRAGDKIVSAIADPSGVLVTPISTVFAHEYAQDVSVAADATQFFVGHAGKLARVAADNSLIGITTGFPVDEPVLGRTSPIYVVWDGIAGWFLANDQIQRFSALGEPAGPLMVEYVYDAIPGRDKLLVLVHDMDELVVLGFSSQASEVTREPVGAGFGNGAIARIGEQILGMWEVMETRLAIIPAP